MKFEWDSNKAALNLAKHGISFTEAETVFDDPFFLTFPDILHSISEMRYVILGESELFRLLVVSYTERGLVTRLISARRATPKEVRKYEKEKYQ
ncbi:MAG: BrnT family toxin [Acidobacteriota bacterium]|nr:BrnT family toxin [Acidobacteriota bacterium]